MAGAAEPVLRRTRYGAVFYDPGPARYVQLGAEDADALQRLVAGTPASARLGDLAAVIRRAGDRLTVIPEAPFNVPLKLFVNLTKRCNLYCAHCFNGSGEKDAPELPFEALGRLLESCERLGVFKLTLAGGEPLIYSRFTDLCRRLSGAAFDVSVVTNGIPLTDRRVAEIVGCEPIRGITVSLEGATEETNAQMRGAGSFAGALAGLRRLVASYQGEVSLRTTVHRGNRHERSALVDLAAGEGIRRLKINRLNPYGRGADLDSQRLSDDEFEAFAVDLVALAKPRGISVEVPANKYLVEKSGVLGLCRSGVETMEIDADGRIYPCSFSAGRYCFGSIVGGDFEGALSEAESFSINNDFCMNCRGRGGTLKRPIGYVPGLVTAAG
jgi:MoaA/NifB/PqqE/SkfB family radical SAM enzyme